MTTAAAIAPNPARMTPSPRLTPAAPPVLFASPVVVEVEVDVEVVVPVVLIALSPKLTLNEFPINTVNFALLTTSAALKFARVFAKAWRVARVVFMPVVLNNNCVYR